MEVGSPNRLLQEIEPALRHTFASRFQLTPVRKGQVIQDAGQEVQWVWFPLSGLISVLAENLGGESVSAALIGWEGAYGAIESCGSRIGHSSASVQVPGQMWRLPASAFRDLHDASPGLRSAVQKHVEASLIECRQHVACNALHSVENRLSRVLLDIHERSDVGDRLPLTQGSLAQLLGVQRTTVAVTTSALQKAGLIRTARGAIEILSASRLERMACSCRRSIAFAHEEIHRATFLARLGSSSAET